MCGACRDYSRLALGSNQKDFELGSDLNYVRGIHTVRTGIALEGRHYRSDDVSNYLGTFVFSNTADFLAGRPRNYTRRLGDPLISYWHLEAGLYVQDDLKLRSNLTFSPGLRWEAQTHVHDLSGFAPRLGLTWAPGSDGNTTVRTSYGIFYNWFGSNTYAQTLRVNGVRQQEINIVNPSYPDPCAIGAATPSNQYVLGDLKMERWHRFSAAVNRTVSPKVRVSLSYSMGRFGNQLRGLNVNAPVNGVRPDTAFANIIQVVPDAASRNYDLSPDLNINLSGGVRNATQARWNPKRTVIRFNYRYHRGYNNSDGAFSVAPTGSLADQWSIAPGDVTHRLRGSVSTQALRARELQRVQRRHDVAVVPAGDIGLEPAPGRLLGALRFLGGRHDEARHSVLFFGIRHWLFFGGAGHQDAGHHRPYASDTR